MSAHGHDEPFVRLTRASVEFRLHEHRMGTLKEWVVDVVRGGRGPSRTLRALEDVSLELGPGSRLAVMGPNGAGKSLLLKLIAGIYAPTRGAVVTRGDVAALIELGAGLDGEMTGRENIFLHSALLGRGPRETRGRIDAVLDFAGLRDFADVPFKYYSSGMQLRLAFSVATDVRPHILLLDELFAGGDAEFMARARERMRALIRDSAILVLVSHDLDLLEEYCESAIVLRAGVASRRMGVAEARGLYLEAAAAPCSPP